MKKEITYKNAQLQYHVVGAGMPVVLIHGFAEDHNVWSRQIDALEDVCKLIIPDLPGSGTSQLITAEQVGIEDYAAVIKEILTAENIDKCIVLGHSMGGYIALAFAELFPDHLLGFGLVHSTAFADSTEKKQVRTRAIEVIKEQGASSFIKTTSSNLFASKFKKEQPEGMEEFIKSNLYFSEDALIQYYSAMRERPDRTQTLQQSKVPVLFVIGEEDSAAPLDDLLQQVHLSAIAHIHIIPENGHMSMLEHPDILNNHLQQFIHFIGQNKS